MSFFLMERTFPPLIAFLKISSHGERLFVVRLVSNPGEKFVDWFFENRIDYRTLLSLFECVISLGECS